MDGQTPGYMTDLGYTFGYYSGLNPVNIRLPLLYAGIAPPQVATACELGSGQGVSVNVHAAASTVSWWATDFNSSQATFAQSLADASGAGPHLFDESFAEFCARPDLPPMDFIALHGIWSWVSDDNRRIIVDFVRRKLKVGGVLYISYNTQPGWAAMAPVRELLAQHAQVMGTQGQGRIARADAAIAFAEKLLQANPAFARANPQIAERIGKLATHDRKYVVHEYFNDHWEPMSIARITMWLEPAKLQFAAPANCLEAVDSMNLLPEQQALLAAIPDAGLRQTARDFCIDQGFRKDYWVRGPLRLTMAQQVNELRKQTVMLATPRPDVTLKATGSQGDIALNGDIYEPILDALADHQPRTLRELEALMRPRGIELGQMVQAVMVLIGKRSVQAVQDAGAIEAAAPASRRLNRHLMNASAMGGELDYLCSPVTGGAYLVPRFHQLFLRSVAAGKTHPQDWARDAWAVLHAQAQQIVKDDKLLATPEENLAELTRQATEFGAKRLGVIRALGAI